MSLLNNHVEALKQVYGISAAELREKLGRREAVNGFVAAAVWNTDTERRKEELLIKDPAGVVAGLKALSLLTGAHGAVIVTPLEKVEDVLLEAAEQAELTLCIEKKSDLVKFDHRDDLLVSLDEAASIAAKLTGEEPGVLVAVDDGELQEFPADTKVMKLLPKVFKAVLSDHRFYAPEELETLTLGELSSKSGVLRVLSDADCIVDRAKKELNVLRKKSCGRCTFCREGLFQLSAIAEDLSTGRLKPQALELAKELTEAMRVSTNCSLGEDAGCPMASLLSAFPREVEAHARRKECPAGVCAAFTIFYIDPAKCVGSRECVKLCPAGAIEYQPGYTSIIESFDCTKCGACLTECPQNAIVKVSGRARIPDKPARLKGATVVTEKVVEEAAPAKREGAGKRKRGFAKPAGSAVQTPAPAPKPENPEPVPAAAVTPAQAPMHAETTAPAPAAASEPVRPAAPAVVAPTASRDSAGKRKRTYVKPIKPE